MHTKQTACSPTRPGSTFFDTEKRNERVTKLCGAFVVYKPFTNGYLFVWYNH